MSLISWLMFLWDMQWGEFRFMYKHVVRTSIPEETWNLPFQLSPILNLTFEFFMWNQKFWNPKHPDMGWIGNFYRKDAKENSTWLGSISKLIWATYPPKPIFITDGQTNKCTQKLFFAYAVTFIISPSYFCSLFVFWGNLCTNPILRSSGSSPAPAAEPQPVPVSPNSSALLQASFYQDLCHWALFSTRTNLSSTDKATSGSLTFDKRICCSAHYKKFCQQTF